MIRVYLFTIAVILFIPFESVASEKGYQPPLGYVPTAKVAAEIAEAVLVPIYGQANIAKQKPFQIQLIDGVWVIEGTLHQPPTGMVIGGVFTIKISRKTGEIIYVMHSK